MTIYLLFWWWLCSQLNTWFIKSLDIVTPKTTPLHFLLKDQYVRLEGFVSWLSLTLPLVSMSEYKSWLLDLGGGMRSIKCRSSVGTFSSCPCSVLLKLQQFVYVGQITERESESRVKTLHEGDFQVHFLSLCAVLFWRWEEEVVGEGPFSSAQCGCFIVVSNRHGSVSFYSL